MDLPPLPPTPLTGALFAVVVADLPPLPHGAVRVACLPFVVVVLPFFYLSFLRSLTRTGYGHELIS